MRGSARAEGAVERVMLPSGTWWTTREPAGTINDAIVVYRGAIDLFQGGNA